MSPHVLHFNAAPGTTEDKQFTIRNTGTGTLLADVGQPKHNPPFSILSNSGMLSIAPNSSVTVTVQYAPAKSGNTSDSIPITSNDPKSKKDSVNLKGKSKAPKH